MQAEWTCPLDEDAVGSPGGLTDGDIRLNIHERKGDGMERCKWCLCNEKMVKYHDEEWGIPLHDDGRQFEFLMMEVMQCGLNWNMMIQKREIFRDCFDGFDYEKVALYGEDDIERIMQTEGMIRSRRKIEAVIHNARCFQKVREEFGSFSAYLWRFSDGKTIFYEGHESGELPARNGLSDEVSRDLKKRGFKYLGSITVYSHLQACGIINDHVKECFRYEDVAGRVPDI
ncbi:DNA-3-methyladenine glycosylase I [Lachnospiraceae bacterium]|nr:DNA-3-methyladenine glycosylase I [Lachnospiraceae bacterium]